jgi:hypothetical protein
MAQITFLATERDREILWDIIFSEMELTAFPDPWFGELPAPSLTTEADVAANLSEYPRVAPGLSYFLTSPAWSMEPLVYHLCKDNPHFAAHWNVHPRYGGPSIQFVPAYAYPWHKTPGQIIAGNFSNYSCYCSAADPGQIMHRPDGLARAMNTIRSRLQSHGQVVRAPTGERAIAMMDALDSHRNGTILRCGDIIFSPMSRDSRTRRCT